MTMLKKFICEMPKDDKFINAFCLGFTLLIAAIIAVGAYSCGASLAVSMAIALVIVLFACGYRFILLWDLFHDSLDGSPRRSTSDYVVTGLTGR